jgi:tetratricopeptide (TPR) repeat protein
MTGVTSAADNAAPKPAVVFMDKGLDVKGSVPRCHQPASLTREILRQAFLVAAREELGIATRDAWMGSEMPNSKEKAAGNLPFDVAFSLSTDEYEARIVRGVGRQRPTVRDTDFKLEHDANYLGLLEQAEEASRTRFVTALEAAGFMKASADPEIDDDATKRALEALDQLDEIQLFAALRQLHAMRGGKGVDEQARLGGLARGYALLGLLTEHCWDPLSKDLKARGLVYAQRMVAQHPESPLGWWHRANVLALTGLHAAALEDLARAEKLAAGQGKKAARPPWVPAIDAFCRMDLADLDASRTDAPVLAGLLEFMALDLAACGPQATAVGVRLLEKETSCLWLMDAIAKLGYLGPSAAVTSAAAHEVASVIVSESVRLDGFPASAKPKALPRAGAKAGPATEGTVDFTATSSLVRGLLDCGRLEPKGGAGLPERGEPRWETLGLLVRELTWMAVYDRGKYERLQYGVPTDEWLSLARPIIALHPYGDTVLLYASDPAVRAKATEATLAYRPDVLEQAMLPFFDRTIPFDDKRRATLSRVAARFVDDTAGELARFLRYTSADEESFDYWQSRLREVSPHSPMIQLTAITRGLRPQPGDENAIARQAEQFASVAAKVGRRHLDREEYDEADALLERAAKLSHDGQTYQVWAEVHARKGDDRRWLEVLEAALEEPDFGLQHASIRCAIARKLLYAGKAEQALPYAEQAARTYSGDGIDLLAQCHEALRKWDRAEAVLKAGFNRYPGTVGWYAFCRRTGKGDARAAETQLREVLESGRLDRMRAADAAYELARLAGDAVAMRRALEVAPAIASHPSYQLLFMLNDQPPPTGEALQEKLDAVITAATKAAGPGVGGPRPELVALAKALTEVGLEPAGRIDAAPLQALAAKLDSRKRCSLQYLLGLVLEREGREAEAVAEWTECLKLADMNYSMRTLAGAKLVARGVKADDFPPLEPMAGE